MSTNISSEESKICVDYLEDKRYSSVPFERTGRLRLRFSINPRDAMSDHSRLPLSTHPTLGVGCFAPNWGALCNWDRLDSQTNPMKCFETRGDVDFLFVRDQARAKMLLHSLERLLPEMEKEVASGIALSTQKSKVDWLRNLRGRLMQLVKSKEEPKMISQVEKLSDKYSHEVNREEYVLFAKRSIGNRKGAGKKPRSVQGLRKCIQKRFKTPTLPPLVMVRELMLQIEKEQEDAQKMVTERKLRQEFEKEAKTRHKREVERLKRRVNKLEKEKALRGPVPATNSEVEESVQTAIEAIKLLPGPGADSVPPENFVLGLPHMDTSMSLPADAVIRRTETAIEILRPGSQEPSIFPTPKDLTIPLNFHTADGKRVSQPWPLVVGCTVRRTEDGTVLYEWD